MLERASGVAESDALSQLERDFRVCYDEDTYRQSAPYPGVQGALERLRARGSWLHIATNKRSSPTRKIVAHLKWGGAFQSVYCIDSETSCASGKRAIIETLMRAQGLDPRETVYIGDTVEDADAANSVGIRFIGVGWGYGRLALEARFPGMRLTADPAEL